ncbi:DNA/RNA helicase domain-containing protein [Amycolatopsis sp. NPDC023774]|uniref:DNA/RNA helicase domain-containing protein n=1 Tax=Amycolatopsis sp. NPDC023774 TaxID=3155015 RepID=UPI00340453CD
MLYGGRVEAIHAELTASTAEFVTRVADEFEKVSGAPPSRSEKRSWERSWLPLLEALVEAGLGGLWMSLEFGLPRTGERVDALLLGMRPDGVLVTVVVELKQWTKADVVVGDGLWVYAGDRVVAHPSWQVAGYEHYLREWVDPEPREFEVRGAVVLHDAPAGLVAELVQAVAGMASCRTVSLLGQDDLRGTKDELAKRLGCADLTPPAEAEIKWFLALPHRPSAALFDELQRVLAVDSRFRLIGRQQDAYAALLEAISDAAHQGTRRVVAVRGGPGTGKTVIAARLLAEIPGYVRPSGIDCTAQFLTPTKTLRSQLIRAAAGHTGKGLFSFVEAWKPRAGGMEVAIVDEAQRINMARHNLKRVMQKAAVTVVFFDERQVIRPTEGFTVAELRSFADSAGVTPAPVEVDLQAQFRCGGSQRYQNWLGSVLSQSKAEVRWPVDADYDFGVAEDPKALQAWLDKHNADGRRARMTAGFCWEWTKTTSSQPLVDDVKVTWTDARGVNREWRRPWNAATQVLDAERRPVAPESVYWATDDGGEGQVGCIYTAQAMEYEYGGVIMGRDLVWRDGGWVAIPDKNVDPAFKKAGLTPEQYLPLALNIYWVLMTRASRGCRVYSVDEQTQQHLRTLVPGRAS